MNSELEKQFEEMVVACGELDRHEIRYHETEDRIEDLERAVEQCELTKTGKIVVGIITFFMSNTILMIFFGGILDYIMALYLVVIIVIVTVAIKFVAREYRAFKTHDREKLLEEIETEKGNLNGVLTVMRSVLMMYEDAFKGMPEEYIYSIAIKEMHKYVRQGRAHTIPDAINLYEEQLHRWRIEEQNGQLLDSQYRQEQRLANIEFYSSLSAYFN